jgi:cell surface protein SprA
VAYLKRIYFYIVFIFIVFIIVFDATAQNNQDTVKLPYGINPMGANPYDKQKPSSNINFPLPDNVKKVVEYDAKTNQYTIRYKIGNIDYLPPYTMSFDEYKEYDIQQKLKETWRNKYKSESFEHQNSLIPKINIGGDAFETIFGSSTIDIRPSGSASLKFGIKIAKNENPSQPTELQSNTTFDFKEDIQMSVVGKIGDNLEMKVNYNTESQFDFDNTMNLRYQGKEDDIIQKIEAGDVSLPLTTSLISGSQSLFGILSQLKFGNLYVTSIFSQQEGETKTISVEGGAQKSEYSLPAVKYDRNRHFFLSQFFRTHYDEFMKGLPTINSTINITKVEVWVTNTKHKTDNARNILALMDLGEEKSVVDMYGRKEQAIYNNTISDGLKSVPDNFANSLYGSLSKDTVSRNVNNISRIMTSAGYTGGKDFEKVEYAWKLSSKDYTYDSKLGYLSLNSALNGDEVLAVAYEYTYNGKTYKVGEFSQDGIENPSVLFVKLLKGTNFTPQYPNWRLMMKNIYSIGAYQVNKEDFYFEVEYYDDKTGTRLFNIPDKNKVLSDSLKNEKFIRQLNLDNLNSQGDYVPTGDGVFDFIDGITIKSRNGRIVFPVVEPFGGFMRQSILDDIGRPGNNGRDETMEIANKMVFQALYDSTQYKAEQITSKNKYYLSGTYKSSGGSEIYLNSFNIPEGSVKVTAGGIVLKENVDYTVDYNMGRVKILNESYLASGTPLKITLESNSMFSLQSKTLMGTHFDYRFNPDFNIGATIMNLTERPLTQKVSMGDEPISNTIWGLNGSYRSNVPFLTRMVDFLPFLQTKEMSTVTFEGEFAQLIPGHNTAIGKNGNAFIDDFEGSESSIDIRNRTGWVLASVPQIPSIFPEAADYTGLSSGFNRAKLAWYQIDPIFYRSGSPISDDQQSSLKVHTFHEQDIFPDKDTPQNLPTEISTLDLAFYPDERGPYNFDTTATTVSAGIDANGKLIDPVTRWGGIMRELNTNDFETQNVEYLMFWLMDPFVEDSKGDKGGELYFHLGNVSEDILKDGRKVFEHGLPTDVPAKTTSYIKTQWGRVPAIQPVSNAFVNSAELRTLQDIGFDGLGSNIKSDGVHSDESVYFQKYIDKVATIVKPDVLKNIETDPSNDNYHYFRGGDYDSQGLGILERYKKFNNPEGNTPVGENTDENYNTVSQQYPDVEDINGDFTLNENEAFFEYRIDLDSTNLKPGFNYINNVQTASIELKNGDKRTVNWYQFKIPLDAGVAHGGIQDFKSIRFIRMFMRGWEKPIVLRFAKLELVRSEWRKYDFVIKEGGESIGDGDESHNPNDVPFTVAAVNIEENGSRSPVNYILPPGVDRQQDPGNPQLTQLNEQSMAIKVSDLEDGYAKAVYKNLNMDMRDYGKLQMFIHAESMFDDLAREVKDNDVTCFIRIGADFTDNYYEYEVPLKITLPWVGSPYNDADREVVWPVENNMIIDFDKLINAKIKRNDAMRKANSTISYTNKFIVYDGKNRILVKGNPNIANVNTIMIGIRNPERKYNSKTKDDGNKKSVEIWVNELRLTDFDEKGGWAATGRMTARLADLGTLSLAGSTTQPGFGSIEQSGQQRAKEESNQLDVSTNVEMGKFFPKDANIRIPMFVGYSRTAINPEYNPLDQDVKLENTLNSKTLTEQEKKDIVEEIQDLTERKSFNFTNVGVGRSKNGKNHFYSPSNLTASYSYTEMGHRDVGVKHNNIKTHIGSLNYVFNNQPKNIRPFKKVKLLQKPVFKLIGDFNFYYAPQQVSFRTVMNRKYGERLLRNINNPAQVFTPTFDKNFTWTRQFDFKYNFSKSLKFGYSTNTNAMIEEPFGDVNNLNESEYEKYKKTVWNSIKSFGNPNLFTQKFDASYTIPINKIRLLNWISANARYGGTYEWKRGPIVQPGAIDVKNTIKNTQQISLNGQFNLNNLYNKAGFLNKLNRKYRQSKKQRNKPKFETVKFSRANIKLKAGVSKRITHNLKTEDKIVVKVVNADGKEIKSKFKIISENKIDITVDTDEQDVLVEVTGEKQIKNNPLVVGLEYTGLMIIGLKQLSGSVSQNRGTMVSGYKRGHQFTELPNYPGLPFIFGWQYDDLEFVNQLVANDMLIDSAGMIPPYSTSNNISYNLKAQYQPVRDLRIDFAGIRSETHNIRQYIYPKTDGFDIRDKMITGNYNVNIWMLGSSFKDNPTLINPRSVTFEKYSRNLNTVAWRLANERKEYAQENGIPYNPQYVSDTIFPLGYNSTNSDVAIPAFLAAYTNRDVNTINTDFKSWAFFRPSWRVKFDGLKNIDFLSKRFRNITLTHGYMATFTVGGYNSNIAYDYEAAKSGYSWAIGGVDSALFVTEFDIATFAATEQFVPLFGVDMTWRNNVLSRLEFKKTRNLTMSLANNQMTEVYTQELTIGTGYRFDKLKLIINKKPFVSDLNLRADFSIRSNSSISHDLAQKHSSLTQGLNVLTFKFTADYQFTDKLTLRAYYDHNRNNPLVGSFNTANTEFGFMVRFSLAQ